MTREHFLARLKDFSQLAKAKGVSSIDDFVRFVGDDANLGPASYGGNTMCTEVRYKEKSFFVDMGTGIRSAMTEASKLGKREFHIFQTHMHWDHIMGFPYCIPIYSEGNKFFIYHVHKNAPEYLRINFNGVNFPLKWDQLSADIEFVQLKLYESVKFDDMSVTPFVLDHPGGSFGYNFKANNKSFSIGVDGEFQRSSRDELGKDLPFYKDLDLLIFDSQYEIDELASRHDWGHSSPNIGVEIALRENIKNVVFTHHDPWGDEERLARMLKTAKVYRDKKLVSFKDEWKQQPTGPNLQMAYDGLTIQL